MNLRSVSELSDSDLLARVRGLARAEYRATAALIAHLMEVEHRKLYLGEACSSLFKYCVRVLHYSEPAAYNRILAARAARAFPAVLTHLDRGDVHLAAVRLLAPVLTAENHSELLVAAVHKTKREVEELVARTRPQPDARGAVRKLPAVARPVVSPMTTARPAAQPKVEQPGLTEPMTAQPALAGPAAEQPGLERRRAERAPADVSPTATQPCPVPAPPQPQRDAAGPASETPPQQQQRASIVPLAAERYRIQFTATRATRDKLRRAQELLRHRIPDGDLSQIFDQALDLLVRDLEKKKFAALAPRPGTASSVLAAPQRARAEERAAETLCSRHIPAEVRRAVWQRDQGRCAFTGSNGERCDERSGLEFDHVRPRADGGGVEVTNIRLLCRQHNQYEARQFFGVWQADPQRVPGSG